MTFLFSGELSLIGNLLPITPWTCTRCERGLMMQQIVRSKDAQCNTGLWYSMTCMPRCKLTDCTRPRVLSQTYKNDNHSLAKQKCLFASLVKHVAKSEAFSV